MVILTLFTVKANGTTDVTKTYKADIYETADGHEDAKTANVEKKVHSDIKTATASPPATIYQEGEAENIPEKTLSHNDGNKPATAAELTNDSHHEDELEIRRLDARSKRQIYSLPLVYPYGGTYRVRKGSRQAC